MCCLFGIYDYGHSLTAAQKKRLVSALAVASEDRGTDATGIAYNHSGHLTVYKRPYPAHLMRFRLPDDAACIMGHTRMTTQGNEKHNYNNHPFEGTAGIPFALAHNGVLYNDLTLRKDKNLPHTRIETDSYVAVQLLAQQGELSFRSIRSAVEPLRGTLTLSVLDGRENLYIIKGNNPLTLYHFPRMGLYVYASTEQILKKGLKKGMPRTEQPFEVMLREGDILRIDRQGQYTVERFDIRNLWDGMTRFSWPYWDVYAGQDEYINDLKSVASAYGYTPHDIDVFLSYGLCPEEIEEIMCCGEVRHSSPIIPSMPLSFSGRSGVLSCRSFWDRPESSRYRLPGTAIGTIYWETVPGTAPMWWQHRPDCCRKPGKRRGKMPRPRQNQLPDLLPEIIRIIRTIYMQKAVNNNEKRGIHA